MEEPKVAAAMAATEGTPSSDGFSTRGMMMSRPQRGQWPFLPAQSGGPLMTLPHSHATRIQAVASVLALTATPLFCMLGMKTAAEQTEQRTLFPAKLSGALKRAPHEHLIL